MPEPGLYANIAAKKRRIAAGSGEKMRKRGAKGSPTAANFRRAAQTADRKSTRLNSSHLVISYAVFCLKKKKKS